MFACLNYGYRCFGNASGLVLTFLLCCYAPGYHALLVASILFIFLCLLVVHVDVGDGHASQYAMLSGNDLLLIWWIFM